MYKQQAQQRTLPRKISDLELINIWLEQIPPIQQSSHLYIAQMFLKFVKKPLEKVTPADVIAFANAQGIRSQNWESYQHKRVETINYLLKFGQQNGVLPATKKNYYSKKNLVSYYYKLK